MAKEMSFIYILLATAKEKWNFEMIQLGPWTEPRSVTFSQRSARNFADTSDQLDKG